MTADSAGANRTVTAWCKAEGCRPGWNPDAGWSRLGGPWRAETIVGRKTLEKQNLLLVRELG